MQNKKFSYFLLTLAALVVLSLWLSPLWSTAVGSTFSISTLRKKQSQNYFSFAVTPSSNVSTTFFISPTGTVNKSKAKEETKFFSPEKAVRNSTKKTYQLRARDVNEAGTSLLATPSVNTDEDHQDMNGKMKSLSALKVFQRCPIIWRDFPVYRYPNLTQLSISEGVLLTSNDDKKLEEMNVRSENEMPQDSEEFSSMMMGGKFIPRYPCYNHNTSSQRRRPIRIFVPWEHGTGFSPEKIPCSIPCEMVWDHKKISSSSSSSSEKIDGFVVDTNGALVNEKYDWPRNPHHLKLIVVNIENIKGRRKKLKKGYGIRYLAKPWNETFWDQFHLVVSYESAAIVRMSFFYWAVCREKLIFTQRDRMAGIISLGRATNPLQQQKPNKIPATETNWKRDPKSLALFFARNCDFLSHKRDGFVRSLQKYLKVDAVGKCLNNKEQSSVRNCQSIPEKNRRFCIISSYYFYLAVENSISLDYVTEKLFEPLMLGTIPIYLGAPNVENFLPTSHSAILAVDFTSMEQLAHYVKCVHRNQTLYQHYVHWHQRPLFHSWQKMVNAWPPLCQVCLHLARNSSVMYDPSVRRPKVVSGIYAENFQSQKPFAECLRST